MTERAQPGPFSSGSSWGINFLLPYFAAFLDEHRQPASKTKVLDLYGCGFAFAARAKRRS